MQFKAFHDNNSLQKLHMGSFDCDQVWEQLEYQVSWKTRFGVNVPALTIERRIFSVEGKPSKCLTLYLRDAIWEILFQKPNCAVSTLVAMHQKKEAAANQATVPQNVN